MVTLSTADNALKSVYLGVVSEQININSNPLLARIKQSDAGVYGKEIIKLAPYGLNGGFGAGSEDGSLPTSGQNNYVQFKSTLKNLYGVIELSDKAVRASANNSGAFVNLLNSEMEGLLKTSSYNLGRMLYGDGSGKIATVVTHTALTDNMVVDDVRNLVEGMTIEAHSVSDNTIVNNTLRRITKIDRANKKIYVETKITPSLGGSSYYLTNQNSQGKEITGLGKIFDTAGDTLYGLTRSSYLWLNPYTAAASGNVITDEEIQSAIDSLEDNAGSTIDFISCSSDVRRKYQTYLASFRRNIDYMELQGGFKAISYAGVPIVSDKFVPAGTMYLLNTKEFTMHQLCDWQWLEDEGGKILRQKAGYPCYTATLVKYADLICDKPYCRKISLILDTG